MFWRSILIKVMVFWEGHKIWKNLCRTFDKSVVFCAPNSVLVKKSTKNSKNKCGQVVLYKLYHKEKFSVVYRRIKIWVPKFPHPYFYKTYQLVYISTSKFEFIFNLKIREQMAFTGWQFWQVSYSAPRILFTFCIYRWKIV